MGVPSDDVMPCTSKQSFPHEEEIRKWPEAAKQFFEEEQDQEVSQTYSCSKTEGLMLSSRATPVPKCQVKQGPIKCSKKLKYKPKDDDE